MAFDLNSANKGEPERLARIKVEPIVIDGVEYVIDPTKANVISYWNAAQLRGDNEALLLSWVMSMVADDQADAFSDALFNPGAQWGAGALRSMCEYVAEAIFGDPTNGSDESSP